MIKLLLETLGIDAVIVIMACFFSIISSIIGLLLYLVAPPSCEEPIVLRRVEFFTQLIFALFIGFILISAHPQIAMLPEPLRMTGALGQILSTYKNVIGGISLLLLSVDALMVCDRQTSIAKCLFSNVLALFGCIGFVLYLCTAVGNNTIPMVLLAMMFLHHVSVKVFGGRKGDNHVNVCETGKAP
jgi:hypothetical protein